jgi:hypothetical protein
LIEPGNVREIGLIRFRDRDTELALLDRQDDIKNSLLIGTGKVSDNNFLHRRSARSGQP